MRTPTAHHVEGFLLGMDYAASIADASNRGHINAIRKEHRTLAMLAARPVTQGMTRELQHSPDPTPASCRPELPTIWHVIIGLAFGVSVLAFFN